MVRRKSPTIKIISLSVLVIGLALAVVGVSGQAVLTSSKANCPDRMCEYYGNYRGATESSTEKTERLEKEAKEKKQGLDLTRGENRGKCVNTVCKCGVAEGCTSEYGFCTKDNCYDVINPADPNKGNWVAEKLFSKTEIEKQYGLEPGTLATKTPIEITKYLIENGLVEVEPIDQNSENSVYLPVIQNNNTSGSNVYLPVIQNNNTSGSNVYFPVIQKYAGQDINNLTSAQLVELLHALSYTVEEGSVSPFVGKTGILNPLWVSTKVGELVGKAVDVFGNILSPGGNK